AVIGHEEIAVIGRWKLAARVEGKTERRRVRLDLESRERDRRTPLAPAESIVDEGAPLNDHAVRPATEAPRLHFGDEVWRTVVAPVTFVDGGPENASRGSERQPHSVPQSRCEQLLARAVRVVANDGRSAPVLLAADVARGTHGDVEPPVRSERDRSRRVVAAAWQALHDDGAPGRLARGRIILKPQHPAHLGDVEVAVL